MFKNLILGAALAAILTAGFTAKGVDIFPVLCIPQPALCHDERGPTGERITICVPQPCVPVIITCTDPSNRECR